MEAGGSDHSRIFTASMKVYIPRFRRTLYGKESAGEPQ